MTGMVHNEGLRSLNSVVERLRETRLDIGAGGADLSLISADREVRIEVVWAGEGFPYDVRKVGVGTGEIPQTVIVAMRKASPGARDALEDSGVNWVDADGNAHIELPGLAIRTGAWTRAGGHGAATLELSKAAWAVAETILDGYQQEQKTHADLPGVHHLAEVSATSSASVSRALQTFDNIGFTQKLGSERGASASRVISDPSGLLSAWAGWYRSRRVQSRTYASITTNTEEFLEAVHAQAISPIVVTGWQALDEYAPFATGSQGISAYVTADDFERVTHGMETMRGVRPVTSGGRYTVLAGDSHTLSLARRSQRVGLVTSPIRLYGDLLRSGVRGDDAAEHLRENVIGF